MDILVTGHQGYIGTRLVSRLLRRGHDIKGIDTGFYRDGVLYSDEDSSGRDGSLRSVQKDIRRMNVDDVTGMDAVVHLAELSNDPLGMHNEENTYDINHQGSVHIAELCKEAGVERFVYTSSCSVYGVQDGDDIKTEASDPIPQTAYARCKELVERDVSQMADDTFTPTFLRNATAYGPSPHMRFDIVLNNLAGYAWTTGTINMTSDGTPWRPLVHVDDICEAIACVLEAPRNTVHNEVFNVGATEENYQVRDIAEVVADVFTGCELSIGTSSADNRSYRVSFDKIHNQLPGFACQYTLKDGARQLKAIFERIEMDDETFEFRAFTRLKQLKHLIETGQIDDRFYWAERTSESPQPSSSTSTVHP
jgi:nucleoside-diphosphate-sugar epimerase